MFQKRKLLSVTIVFHGPLIPVLTPGVYGILRIRSISGFLQGIWIK